MSHNVHANVQHPCRAWYLRRSLDGLSSRASQAMEAAQAWSKGGGAAPEQEGAAPTVDAAALVQGGGASLDALVGAWVHSGPRHAQVGGGRLGAAAGSGLRAAVLGHSFWGAAVQVHTVHCTARVPQPGCNSLSATA